MTDRLINGDYAIAPNQKALVSCDYIDELVQNAYILLSAKLGRFYPNKSFGSRINELTSLQQPIDEYAEAYARQALAQLDGVYVKSAAVNNSQSVDVIIVANDTERQVNIRFGNNI